MKIVLWWGGTNDSLKSGRHYGTAAIGVSGAEWTRRDPVAARTFHYAPAGKSPSAIAAETTGVVVPSVSFSTSKAFDRVWHGLVFKLLNTKSRLHSARTVASFLEGRSFFVAVGRNLGSTTHPRRSATRQLSVSVPVRSLRMISPLSQVNYRTGRTSYSRYTLTIVRTSHHPVGLTWLRPKSRGSSTIARMAGQMASRRKRYERPPY
ncbi:hypothetical protein EVAR_77973_1 [Eumeta japonica]|uniref:Uncharacterized protein n=1 Tax=Eumeta variegata TaxID=151549 RepID=A0A4C1T3D4_EUMVA|nr:hypothetical protein EVAR_77973_1 [Eumeta japonica]